MLIEMNATFFKTLKSHTKLIRYFLPLRFISQDRMLDVYKREGSFPSSDSIGAHHFFRGPIRSHFRPRRLGSVIVMLSTSYFTLPPVLHALYALICSGFINVLIAVTLVLAGITLLKKISSALQIDFTLQ